MFLVLLSGSAVPCIWMFSGTLLGIVFSMFWEIKRQSVGSLRPTKQAHPLPDAGPKLYRVRHSLRPGLPGREHVDTRRSWTSAYTGDEVKQGSGVRPFNISTRGVYAAKTGEAWGSNEPASGEDKVC